MGIKVIHFFWEYAIHQIFLENRLESIHKKSQKGRFFRDSLALFCPVICIKNLQYILCGVVKSLIQMGESEKKPHFSKKCPTNYGTKKGRVCLY